MGERIEQLSEFVASTRWEAIPDSVKRQAKLVLLDTLGVILAGADGGEVKHLSDLFGASGGSGATILARGWKTTDPKSAALLNAIAGRSIELCEGHRYVQMQGGVQIVPGVLAVAEGLQSSGPDILTALILGYDVGARIAAAMKPHALAHPNGQAALLGAIAATSRLRGLNAGQISLALRIGVTLILTPSYTNAVAGATALNVAGGMSGFAAALVPDLVHAGFSAKSDAIEEALGSLVAGGFQPDILVEKLGTRWEISRNSFRLRACCNPIYAALDALEDAIQELKATSEDIERVDVATYRFASVMSDQMPVNVFASKYSLPHAAAAIIHLGHAGYKAFLEDVLINPEIVNLRRRVFVTEDPSLSSVAPRLKPARVTVTLKDGRRSSRFCESPRGDFQRPYARSAIREKFLELANPILGTELAVQIEDMVSNFDTLGSVSRFIDLLTQSTVLNLQGDVPKLRAM